MHATEVLCPGKINLYLKIGAKRPNGYHEVDTLFLPLPGPCDVLTFQPGQAKRVQCSTSPQLFLTSTAPWLSLKKNTLRSAYELYAAASGFAPNVGIHIEKNIPAGAGLGGGSANAACVLEYLQQNNPHALTQEQVHHIAAQVGADVPFFLIKKPCFARGIGEILQECKIQLDGLFLLLVCPCLAVSTPWAYHAWDEWAQGKSVAGFTAKDSLTRSVHVYKSNRSCTELLCWLENDFEVPVFAAYKQVEALKRLLLQTGAQMAAMSGSGSALFGLFRERKKAEQAALLIAEQAATLVKEEQPPRGGTHAEQGVQAQAVSVYGPFAM